MLIDEFESALELDPISADARTALDAVQRVSRASGVAIFLKGADDLELIASNLDRADPRASDQAPVPFVQILIAARGCPVGVLYLEGRDMALPEAARRAQSCAEILGRMLTLPPGSDALPRA